MNPKTKKFERNRSTTVIFFSPNCRWAVTFHSVVGYGICLVTQGTSFFLKKEEGEKKIVNSANIPLSEIAGL